jgi:hypothetical protein
MWELYLSKECRCTDAVYHVVGYHSWIRLVDLQWPVFAEAHMSARQLGTKAGFLVRRLIICSLGCRLPSGHLSHSWPAPIPSILLSLGVEALSMGRPPRKVVAEVARKPLAFACSRHWGCILAYWHPCFVVNCRVFNRYVKSI